MKKETEQTVSDEFSDICRETYRPRIPNIHVGDQVIMNNHYEVSNDHKGVIWTVTAGPKFINGKRCMQLKGYKDWYPVDGLKVVG